MGSSNVDAAKAKLEQAKQQLENEKDSMAQAKANGNYRRAIKNESFGGKVGNVYDRAVYYAKKRVEECKEELAEAKRQAR